MYSSRFNVRELPLNAAESLTPQRAESLSAEHSPQTLPALGYPQHFKLIKVRTDDLLSLEMVFDAFASIAPTMPGKRFYAFRLAPFTWVLAVGDPQGGLIVHGWIRTVMYRPSLDGHLTDVPSEFLTIIGHSE